MFGGKKEKALQDELYTIKKQIAEYSDELKEDSVQMTASRVQMEENIEILEEKLECVGELAEESCRTEKNCTVHSLKYIMLWNLLRQIIPFLLDRWQSRMKRSKKFLNSTRR